MNEHVLEVAKILAMTRALEDAKGVVNRKLMQATQGKVSILYVAPFIETDRKDFPACNQQLPNILKTPSGIYCQFIGLSSRLHEYYLSVLLKERGQYK